MDTSGYVTHMRGKESENKECGAADSLNCCKCGALLYSVCTYATIWWWSESLGEEGLGEAPARRGAPRTHAFTHSRTPGAVYLHQLTYILYVLLGGRKESSSSGGNPRNRDIFGTVVIELTGLERFVIFYIFFYRIGSFHLYQSVRKKGSERSNK